MDNNDKLTDGIGVQGVDGAASLPLTDPTDHPDVKEVSNSGSMSDFEIRMKALDYLLGKFELERKIYLVLICICAVGQLYLIVDSAGAINDWKELLVVLGPSGGLMACCGKLLKMWSDSIYIIQNFR